MDSSIYFKWEGNQPIIFWAGSVFGLGVRFFRVNYMDSRVFHEQCQRYGWVSINIKEKFQLPGGKMEKLLYKD